MFECSFPVTGNLFVHKHSYITLPMEKHIFLYKLQNGQAKMLLHVTWKRFPSFHLKPKSLIFRFSPVAGFKVALFDNVMFIA